MPVDPSIPLQAGQNIPQFGPDMRQVLTMAQLAQRLQEMRQQQQNENALRNLYGNPANLGPNGQPNQNAMSQLMATNPIAGLGLQKDISQIDDQAMKRQYIRAQLDDKGNQALMDVGDRAYMTYMRAKDGGMPEPEAIAAGQKVYEGVKGVKESGVLSPSQAASIPPNFDPKRTGPSVALWKAMKDEDRKTRDEARKDEELDLSKRTAAREDKKAQEGEVEKPVTIEYTDTQGQTHQTTAMFDKGRRAFVDTAGHDMPTNSRIIPPSQVMAGGGGSAQNAGNVAGGEYLATLPKADQDQIKALAEGRMQFPSGYALRSPFWQNRLLQVSQYDPNFDTVNYGSRYKTRQDFTSGKSAQNITSFNTAIGHLGTLSEAADKLNNTWSPTYNTVANFLKNQAGNPTVKAFETARTAVSDELERAFRGTGGNVTGIEEWRKNLDAASSPEQLKAAVRTAVDLLNSRIQAVGEQYQRGMGTTSDPLQLLSEKARETLKKLPGGEQLSFQTEQPGAGSAAPGSAVMPQRGGQDALPISKLSEGQATTFANGQVWTLKDGKPERVE